MYSRIFYLKVGKEYCNHIKPVFYLIFENECTASVAWKIISNKKLRSRPGYIYVFFSRIDVRFFY